MRKRSLLLAALTLALTGFPAQAAAQADTAADSLALARQWTIWFYGGEVDSLVAYYEGDDDPAERRAKYEEFSEMVAERAGFEIEVIEETWKKRNGQTQYKHTGVGLGPLSQAPPTDPPPE
jgi:hypothetical protein